MIMFANRTILFILIISWLLVSPSAVLAESGRSATYSPPFELYGVVKEVGSDALEVFIPHINKQITIFVSPGTKIINRIDKQASPSLNEINVEDLIVIKGIVDKESFYSREISYIPEGK